MIAFLTSTCVGFLSTMCLKLLLSFLYSCSTIMQLQIIIKNQEAALNQRQNADQNTDAATPERVKQLSDVIEKKDQELEV